MTFAIVVFAVLVIPILATTMELWRWRQAEAPTNHAPARPGEHKTAPRTPCRQLVAVGFLALPLSICLLFSHDVLVSTWISPTLLCASIGYVLLGLLARHLDDPGLTILFLTISALPLITRLLVPQNV